MERQSEDAKEKYIYVGLAMGAVFSAAAAASYIFPYITPKQRVHVPQQEEICITQAMKAQSDKSRQSTIHIKPVDAETLARCAPAAPAPENV